MCKVDKDLIETFNKHFKTYTKRACYIGHFDYLKNMF